MINAAIVEDNNLDYEKLKIEIDRFSKEHNEEFSVDHFDNGLAFLENYKPSYDLIFMDIEMPYLDGIEASTKLRSIDPNVKIIFVSNSSQYAVKGYSVDASGYIVKPITKYNFDAVLTKAIDKVKKDNDAYIVISTSDGFKKLYIRDILFIEVLDHDIYFHTDNFTFKKRDSLKNYETKLLNYGFFKCDKSYLVNLKHIDDIKQNDVIIGKNKIKISRPRKKAFIEAYVNYLGDNI